MFCSFWSTVRLYDSEFQIEGVLTLNVFTDIILGTKRNSFSDDGNFLIRSSVCVCFQWEMFSVPELENFLAILTREEADHMDRLRTRYFRLRVHLLNRVRDLLGHWTRFWVCLCLCVCVCVCVSWPGFTHTLFAKNIPWLSMTWKVHFPWPCDVTQQCTMFLLLHNN